MNTMVFNKTVTLVYSETGYGSAGDVDIAIKKVRADVSQPGIKTSAELEALGKKVDLFVRMLRRNYDPKYNYAEIDGVRYRIDDVRPGSKEMFIRLLLVRM